MPIPNLPNPIRQIHQIGSDTPERIVPRDTCRQQSAVHMRACGLSDIGRGYEMSRPDPDFIHILVSVRGSGLIWHNDAWHACPRGQAYVSGIGARHAFRSPQRGRWQVAWVYYAPDAAEQLGLHGGELRLSRLDPDPLALIIDGFWHETIHHAQPDVLDRFADLLHIHITRLCDPRHHSDPLWPLWAEARSKIAEAWDLDRLAATAGMGGEQLRRLCLKHYGRSPMRQLTHLRMQHAAGMLLSTPDKIAAVALRVGYSNEFAFSTAFRAWSGKSPGAFRAR